MMMIFSFTAHICRTRIWWSLLRWTHHLRKFFNFFFHSFFPGVKDSLQWVENGATLGRKWDHHHQFLLLLLFTAEPESNGENGINGHRAQKGKRQDHAKQLLVLHGAAGRIVGSPTKLCRCCWDRRRPVVISPGTVERFHARLICGWLFRAKKKKCLSFKSYQFSQTIQWKFCAGAFPDRWTTRFSTKTDGRVLRGRTSPGNWTNLWGLLSFCEVVVYLLLPTPEVSCQRPATTPPSTEVLSRVAGGWWIGVANQKWAKMAKVSNVAWISIKHIFCLFRSFR